MPFNLLIAVPHVTRPAKPIETKGRLAAKPRTLTSPPTSPPIGSQNPAGKQNGLQTGWVITKMPADSPWDSRTVRLPAAETQCLQIATGQWCAPTNATWFPIRRTAETYAIDYGYSIGQDVRIIRLRKT